MGLGSQGKNTRCSGRPWRATARCGGFVVFVLVHVPGLVVHARGLVLHWIAWLCPRPSWGCAQDTNTNKCSVRCQLPGPCRGACRGRPRACRATRPRACRAGAVPRGPCRAGPRRRRLLGRVAAPGPAAAAGCWAASPRQARRPVAAGFSPGDRYGR